MPKTSSIRSSVSIEHRLVTDRHRHTRTQAHGYYRGCIASRGKNAPYPVRSVGGVPPFCRPWARRWINHWSLWPMASATPDLRLPSQPQGITAWPVPNYTARWQRHMCVNNLPKVVTWKRKARSRTRDRWVASPAFVLTITPEDHTFH